LGGRKGIRPVKNTEHWGAGMVICLELGADLHIAQLMPLPLTTEGIVDITMSLAKMAGPVEMLFGILLLLLSKH